MRNHDSRSIRLATLLYALLGGCTAHASFQTGSYSETGGKLASSGASAPASAPHSQSTSPDARTVERTRGQGLTQVNPAPAAPAPTPVHTSPAVNQPAAAPAATPVAQTQQPRKQHGADHDRGHGNDPGRVDPDNPGTSRAAKPARQGTRTDHDRGHGNDADGVDEDNPGKSKQKKK